MNFTSLRYFLVTAEEGNITHAANRLFISQQALSGHINKLEKELNLRLFHRTPVFSLTYAGRQLMEYASAVVNLERQIHQMSDDNNDGQRGELRVGISHTCGQVVLPAVLPNFRKRYPLVNILLQEATSREMEDAMQHGKLDLMIDTTPISLEGATYEKLITERLFLVAPKAMLQARYGACYDAVLSECSRALDLFLFDKLPFILLKKGNRTRAMLEGYMKRIGFVPNIVLETENVETAFALAQQGMGLTVYPELFRWCLPAANQAEETVEFFPFRDEGTIGTLVIAWMQGYYQTRYALDFIEACHSAAAEIQKKQVGA